MLVRKAVWSDMGNKFMVNIFVWLTVDS